VGAADFCAQARGSISVTFASLTSALLAPPAASSPRRPHPHPGLKRLDVASRARQPRKDRLSEGQGLLAVAPGVTHEHTPCSTRIAMRRPPTPEATSLWRQVGLKWGQTLLERIWSEGFGEVEARRSLLRGRAVPRASFTERGPGASGADSPLYVRAGKVRDCERCPPRDLSFTTLTPPPLLRVSVRSGVHVCGCGALFVCVCERAALCALHVVSPRDRWSCVLPRWQFNVNVNV